MVFSFFLFEFFFYLVRSSASVSFSLISIRKRWSARTADLFTTRCKSWRDSVGPRKERKKQQKLSSIYPRIRYATIPRPSRRLLRDPHKSVVVTTNQSAGEAHFSSFSWCRRRKKCFLFYLFIFFGRVFLFRLVPFSPWTSRAYRYPKIVNQKSLAILFIASDERSWSRKKIYKTKIERKEKKKKMGGI